MQTRYCSLPKVSSQKFKINNNTCKIIVNKSFVQALLIFYPSNIFLMQAIKKKIVYES